jgi:hypothetical protein
VRNSAGFGEGHIRTTSNDGGSVNREEDKTQMSVYVAGLGEIVVVRRWVGEDDATAFALATVKGCRNDKVVVEGAGREVFLCDPASILDGSELEAGEEEEESKAVEEEREEDAEEGADDSAFEMWTDEMAQGAELPAIDEVGEAAVTRMCNTYVETRDLDSSLAVLGQEQLEDQDRIVSRLLRAINSSSMTGPAHVQHRVVALFLLAKLLARRSDVETTSQLLQFLRDYLLSLPAVPAGIATELVTGSLSL